MDKKRMWVVIKFYDAYSIDDIPRKPLDKICKILNKTGLRYSYELNHSSNINLEEELDV